MVSSRWQKQNMNLWKIVWAAAAIISFLLFMLLFLLGWRMEAAGVIFIAVFFGLRILLAFLLKNRFANSMVRILKFNYEELERDFRTVFKNKYIRFIRRSEEDAYHYEFPGHHLNMTVKPYWLSGDIQSVTLVTQHGLTAKNQAFAEMFAEAIDEMAEQRANDREKPEQGSG